MKIPRDKLLHFLVGAVIAAWLAPFGWPFALGAVLVAAVGKEVYDRIRGGDVELMDVAATLAGGIVSVIVVLVVTLGNCAR